MIDLRSDTVTKPSAGMREAMAQASVGDDVYGEDPTVNQLQEMAADLVGKKAALFVPSGTMANQLALRVLTRPGQEVIVDGRSHIVSYEQGAAGALSGLQFHWMTTDRGVLSAEQVEHAIRPQDPHIIQTGLIALENTHNTGGGSVYPLTTIQAIRAVAQRHDLPMHLDGARLFNAVVATGVSPRDYAANFNTVSFCLSKGLGAPAGSIIATNDISLIGDLRRFRRMFGGAMRQAGILAAAGIYALTNNIELLRDDHRHAKQLAEVLNSIPSVSIRTEQVETNIIMFDVRESCQTPSEVVQALRQEGVLVNAIGGQRIRAVTHLDVSDSDIEDAGQIFRKVFASSS